VNITRNYLRHLRRTRVTAVQCGYCQQWVKPRYIALPAWICRRCEAQGLNQTWKPSPSRLAAARKAAIEEQQRRHHATRRTTVTLAGR
jgi:ribosomal protein L37AE/L43A